MTGMTNIELAAAAEARTLLVWDQPRAGGPRLVHALHGGLDWWSICIIVTGAYFTTDSTWLRPATAEDLLVMA